MLQDWSSWHHTPFEQRVMTGGYPYFVIVRGTRTENPDASRRRALADLAGL